MPFYITQSGDLVGCHACLTDWLTDSHLKDSATQLLISIRLELSSRNYYKPSNINGIFSSLTKRQSKSYSTHLTQIFENSLLGQFAKNCQEQQLAKKCSTPQSAKKCQEHHNHPHHSDHPDWAIKRLIKKIYIQNSYCLLHLVWWWLITLRARLSDFLNFI